MFAPPPVQLSRSEIQTRLAGEGQDAERRASSDKSSEKSSLNTPSLHRNESRSPLSPFRKRSTAKASRSPVVSPSPSSSPPDCHIPPVEASTTPRSQAERLSILPAGFENPRPAPEPPKRQLPSLTEPWRPPLPGAFPLPLEAVSSAPESEGTAPPIPPKSARRPSGAHARAEASQTTQDQARNPAPLENFNARMANLEKMPTRPQRTSSVPSMPSRNYSHPSTSPLHSTNSSRGMRVRSAGIHKALASNKATSTAAHRGLPYAEPRKSGNDISRRATESTTRAAEPHVLQTSQHVPRGQVGSAADSANHNVNGIESLEKYRIGQKNGMSYSPAGLDVGSQVKFMEKALPDTPTSIIGTPTEVYQHTQPSPPLVQRSKSQKSQSKRRSPLAQLAATDVKANSPRIPQHEVWPGRLSVIPEHTGSEEKLGPLSGASTPVPKQMHLRGGSVVTVSPPESTPWQRTLYIQGPIKLPKPAIVPRKNSLASLDPFQDAIDQMYQDALYIPRRRSDDKVLDDVCDFFDNFGFEQVAFSGDNLLPDRMEIDDVTEAGNSELERFSTPPPEPAVSPVERTVARDIVERISPMPLEGPDNGMASHAVRVLRRTSVPSKPRKDSATLSQSDMCMAMSTHAAKKAVPNGFAVRLQVEGNARKTSEQPKDRKIVVEELDASSEWIAPALFKKVWSKQGILREKSISKRFAG